jgi:hypothetical protein
LGGKEIAQAYLNRGVACYDDWFRRMSENGENYSSVWMAPWSYALEWSPTLPGFDGLGRYNQINAAKLDRVIEAAEKHGIYINLFTQNHGALSSVVDGEWHNNPMNQRFSGGFLTYASEFFTSERAQKLHRNKIRYTIARWGYSTAIAGWLICTETDWVEAYNNQRSLHPEDRDPLLGRPREHFPIPDQRPLVRQWLVDMARYFKETDAHPHVVSTQFCEKTQGLEMWDCDELDVVSHSCYTHDALDVDWLGEHFVGSQGIADIMFVYGKRFEKYDDRPVLLMEWGGDTTRNFASHLRAELHTGIWTLFMTNTAGSFGFWWCNLVDTENLYPHYRALARFAEGEDRRGRQFQSSRAQISSLFPLHDDTGNGNELYIPSPREQGVILHDDTTLYAYVFNRETNQMRTSRPADSFSDIWFGESGISYLHVPSNLRAGSYVIEYWNTFEGEPIERREITLGGERVIPLISHHVDLAVKMKWIKPCSLGHRDNFLDTSR